MIVGIVSLLQQKCRPEAATEQVFVLRVRKDYGLDGGSGTLVSERIRIGPTRWATLESPPQIIDQFAVASSDEGLVLAFFTDDGTTLKCVGHIAIANAALAQFAQAVVSAVEIQGIDWQEVEGVTLPSPTDPH